MSYVRRLSGSFMISPRWPWAIYNHRDFYTDPTSHCLVIEEDVEQVDRHEGQLTRRHAARVVPRSECSYISPLPEIEVLAKLCRDQGGRLLGVLYSVGEDDALDTWRYYTDKSGLVVKDQAILVWPNGNRAYEAVPRSSQPGQESLGGECLVLGDGPMAWPTPISSDRIATTPPWARASS